MLHSIRIFMSQLVSIMVQFHGEVFRFLFCHRIQGKKKERKKERKKETHKKENIPCPFLLVLKNI
jgi:hypothetical protein